MHWSSLDTHASIEGDNGVGKTSLVAVAIYRSQAEYSINGNNQLLIPLNDPIQMAGTYDIEEKIYFNIAKSIIDNQQTFEDAGKSLPRIEDVKNWLSNPIIRSGGANVSSAVAGGGLTVNKTLNSAGYSNSGFYETVNSWLKIIFPENSRDAFVGIIDNLELLETSREARRVLEGLRDTVLKLRGVKWVLCGANGIVRNSVGSPRLTGVIGDPIQISPLDDEHIPLVIDRRIEAYRTSRSAMPPVDPSDFRFLFNVVGRNLRIALKHAQDFSMWLYEEGYRARTGEDSRRLLMEWLEVQAASYEEDTKSVTKSGWAFFDKLFARGGSCSPGEYEEFGFNSQQAMRPSVKQMEDANLVTSSIDDSDQRRRTIMATPNGWLIYYKRQNVEQ